MKSGAWVRELAAKSENIVWEEHMSEFTREELKKLGYVAINPAFGKLIISLSTAVAEKNILDKESTSYADVFDAYRLALKHYKFITQVEDVETVKANKPKPNQNP